VEPCRGRLVRGMVRQARPSATRADRHRPALSRSQLRAAGCGRPVAGPSLRVRVDGDLPEGSDPLPDGAYGHPWIEFRIGNAVLNIFPLYGERTGEVRTHVPWVYVDDLGAHFAYARENGATIVEEIHPYPGSSVYVADDLEGNRWTFLQARPTMR
jgi:uncharacterized glyoxalase superfamily protein PhnB